MTTKQAVKENVFGLYSEAKNYEKATVEIKEAADALIKAIKKNRKVGAADTESIECIMGYIENLYE